MNDTLKSDMMIVFLSIVNEPPHDKTKKMTYVPSEDSDQPGNPPSFDQSSLFA